MRTPLGVGSKREVLDEKRSPAGTTGPSCPHHTVASAATSKTKIPKDTYRCSWKGKERVGSKKVMVLGHKGAAWGKCRRGWSDVAGACGFNPNGATVLGTKRRSSNLQISHQDRNDSSERSFRGIERGQSHRVRKGLKAPLFAGYSQLHCGREAISSQPCFWTRVRAHLSALLPHVTRLSWGQHRAQGGADGKGTSYSLVSQGGLPRGGGRTRVLIFQGLKPQALILLLASPPGP